MATTQTSGQSVCDYCEFSVPATCVCETCIRRFCDACFGEHHPMRGEFGEHIVTRTPHDLTTAKKCPLHNERFLHFCVTCEKMMCPHCLMIPGKVEKQKKYPHYSHVVVTTEEFIDSKKKKLLKEIENVGHDLESARFGDSEGEDIRLQLEFSWLSYKERVRQEFVSLHDLLMQREQELLRHMQQRVDESLKNITALQSLQKSFEVQETSLTEEGLKLVQDKSQARFIQGYKTILKRCKELAGNIHLMPRFGDVTPTFLKMPFTLVQEKLHLDNLLQFEAYENTSICPKSRTVYFPSHNLNKPIRCAELWNPPKIIPASTSCVYNLEVTSKSSILVRHFDLSIDDFAFNSVGRLCILPDHRYILKVVPVFRIAGYQDQAIDGATVCIMIVTGSTNKMSSPFRKFKYCLPMKINTKATEDECMTKTPEGLFHMQSQFLQAQAPTSFEEERLQANSEQINGPDDARPPTPVSPTYSEERLQANSEQINGPDDARPSTPVSPTYSERTVRERDITASPITTLSITPHQALKMIPDQIEKYSLEESRYMHWTDTLHIPGAFVLDKSRFNMSESYLLHYSFEENRLEYMMTPSSFPPTTLSFQPSRISHQRIKRAVRKIRK